MSKLAKKDENGLSNKPADIAQVTILVDESGSMDSLAQEARLAIATVIQEFKDKHEGMPIAVRSFADKMRTIAEFGTDVPTVIPYRPDGNTALYRSVSEAIAKSKSEAKITPELKTHHVIVIITDGHDTEDKHAIAATVSHADYPDYNDWYAAYEKACKVGGPQLKAAQQSLDSIGVDATFLLLDFSPGGDAGKRLNLKGVKIDHNPKAFRDAMKKVAEAIGQIAENVVKQLPPTTGLCLPPAR